MTHDTQFLLRRELMGGWNFLEICLSLQASTGTVHGFVIWPRDILVGQLPFPPFFSLYDEIPEMPHTVTLEAAFQFWRVVSVDSQHQHEQRSHPQNYGQGKLLVRFRCKYFLLSRRTLVSRRARWPTSLPLQYGFLRCPKSLSLSLYLHREFISENLAKIWSMRI